MSDSYGDRVHGVRPVRQPGRRVSGAGISSEGTLSSEPGRTRWRARRHASYRMSGICRGRNGSCDCSGMPMTWVRTHHVSSGEGRFAMSDGLALATLGSAEHAPGGSVDLTQTLQLVADTIVELLGFEVAVINLADTAESMVVAAVAGPPEVHAQLLNRRQGLSGWSKLVAASEPWGRLRFLDHAKSVTDPADVFSWIPDMPVSDSPNAWHPEDSLFAPLESSDGRHLGMMSVDVPRDGQRPG